MAEQIFRPGEMTFAAVDAPDGRYSAVFEEDAETAYFYAADLSRPDNIILDAVHVYNVANIVDQNRVSTLSIVWSDDGLKCALLINGYAHAAFDFAAKRGFGRTNFPNFPTHAPRCWPRSDHGWSEDAVAWLEIKRSS